MCCLSSDFNSPRDPFEIRCKICGTEFESKSELRQHIQRDHMRSEAAIQKSRSHTEKRLAIKQILRLSLHTIFLRSRSLQVEEKPRSSFECQPLSSCFSLLAVACGGSLPPAIFG